MPAWKQDRPKIERRDYPRLPITIPATIFIFAEKVETPCMVTDLSASGAGVQYEGASPPAERVCRLDISWFGAFEGITIRDGGTSSGVRFLFHEAEQHNLLGKLTKFVEIGLSPATDDDAIDAIHPRLFLKTADGGCHFCEVLNISLKGVLLKADVRPPTGELVRVGSMYGRVDFHDEQGIGVAFVSLLHPLDGSKATRLSL